MYKKNITLKESLCGFSLNFKHLNGQNVYLNNNTNTIIKPTYKKDIPNMGFKRETTTGNLIIEFEVDFPDTLTTEQINTLNRIL